MGRSIVQGVVSVMAVGLLLAACSSSKKTTAHDPPQGTSGAAGADQSGDGGCDPGARRCDGLNVKVCDSTGSSERIEKTCLPDESCNDGECGGSACVAGATFCQGQGLYKCDAKGRTSALVMTCPSGLFCRDDMGSAGCSAQACTPGAALCRGNVATVCLGDGSGPKPGGVDCDESKQTCYAGTCRDQACTPGTKLCQHEDVYLCGNNGTDLTLWADCQANEICDGDLNACRAKLCEPGKVQCDGSRIVTCNAYGSSWLPDAQDCAADGKACSGGSCKAKICAPGKTFCDDGSVYQCDSSGASSSLLDTCDPAYEHCTTYAAGTSAYCAYNQCTAGEKLCSSNTVVTCKDDGTLPASGTPCGGDQYCDGGECKDLGCTPDESFCKNGDVYFCQYAAPPYISQACNDDQPCKALGNGAAICTQRACTPGVKSCVGNQIGSCAADGASIGSVTDNCVTSSSVCTVDLKCAASATDTIGVAENVEVVYAGTLVATAVAMKSPRTLTELEVQLVLAAPRELRWVIYELVGSTYVAKFDKIASSVTGSGFISSGAISFPLAAGKSYLMGVAVSGGDAVTYYDTAPFSQAVSFGNIIGGAYVGYSSSLDVWSIGADQAIQIKTTTTP